jgi:hypothetical protein
VSVILTFFQKWGCNTTITQYTYHDFALSYMNINELKIVSLYDINIIEYNERIKIIWNMFCNCERHNKFLKLVLGIVTSHKMVWIELLIK